MPAPLNGLLLCGGASRRMGFDKASLRLENEKRLTGLLALLRANCHSTYISCQPGQYENTPWESFPQVHDRKPGCGPMSGITAALQQFPSNAWLVLACDLSCMDQATVAELVAQRDPDQYATLFVHGDPPMMEPLCAIYEPGMRPILEKHLSENAYALRSMLRSIPVQAVPTDNVLAFTNVNTPDDLV